MTTDQERAFAQFGCMSRCLIKASEILQKPISRDAFCEKYFHLFPEGQFGALIASDACHIAIDLKLCRKVSAIRDVSMAIQALQNDQLSLVLTDLSLDAAWNRTGTTAHCRLLLGISDHQTLASPLLRVWNPKADLSDEEYDISLAYLDRQLVHFLMFFLT